MKKFEFKDKEINGYIDKTFMKGVLKLMLLKIIEKEKIYPYALLKKINSNKHLNMKISKNDLYNLITVMEKSNLITAKEIIKNKKSHKILIITPKGKNITIKSKNILIKHIKSVKDLMAEMDG